MIGYDLVMESPFTIPGALPLGDHGLSEPDLRIRWLSEQPPPASPDPIYRREGDMLIFSPPGLARFACRPDGIDITPHRDADHALIFALLIATALPAAMWMRGGLVLHAAGVMLPGCDCALALVGPSGVGKSTLAAQLVERGATLIADDSVHIRRRAGRPMASGLPGGYHLADRSNAGRCFVSCPPGRPMGGAALGAVIVLSQADTDGAWQPLARSTRSNSYWPTSIDRGFPRRLVAGPMRCAIAPLSRIRRRFILGGASVARARWTGKIGPRLQVA